MLPLYGDLALPFYKIPEEIWIPCACMDGFMWETVASEWLSAAARQTNEGATVAKGINGLTRCIAAATEATAHFAQNV